MTRKLRIAISGTHNTGKTTVGIALRDFLRERGFSVELADPDASSEQDTLQAMRMEALAGTEVSIATFTTGDIAGYMREQDRALEAFNRSNRSKKG